MYQVSKVPNHPSAFWVYQNRVGLNASQFLTDRSNGPVWGMLSDGEWSIPVKLTREAAEQDRECVVG